MKDALLPVAAVLHDIVPMAADNHLFRFLPEQPLPLAPGQFVEITLAGVGSFPVSSCEQVRDGLITSCIRRAGRVTEALYQLEKGAVVGLRGPFGKGFPLERFKGQDALLIAGGLGMAPLRALLHALLDDPDRTTSIIVLYGSQQPETLLFRDELVALAKERLIELRFSVDFAETLPSLGDRIVCKIGLVNELLAGLTFAPRQTIAAVCGPPALYHCILEELALIGVPASKIFATLERRMRCGIGECCHCVVAGRYICQEGPVFSLAQLRSMTGAV